MDNEQMLEFQIGRPRSFRPFPIRRPVRPRPLFRRGFGFTPAPAPVPSNFILSIQSDLAEILGFAIPLTGTLGPATRRAIRLFQQRFGLSPTGQLSGSTLRAIRRIAAERREPAFPVEPVSEPLEPIGAGPEDDGEPQEEYRITQPGSVTLRRLDTVDLGAHFRAGGKGKSFPAAAGIYVIHDAAKPWYAGQAGNFRERFTPRFAALKDFNIASTALDGKFVTFYALPDAIPTLAVFMARNGIPRGLRKDNVTGILTAIEDHFIRKLGTSGKGNEKLGQATIASGIAATVQITGGPGGPAWESALPGTLALPVR